MGYARSLCRLGAFLGLAVLGLFALPALAATSTTVTITVDGVKREALVFAPDSAGQTAAPVVFGFHGHGGNAEGLVKLMDFQDDWPAAIVVYMQGLPTSNAKDPGGKLPGWQLEAGDDHDRDLKFFDAMLAKLHQLYKVDDKRVYAAGFSNGARFAYLLWGTRADKVAAFAVAAGGMGERT